MSALWKCFGIFLAALCVLLPVDRADAQEIEDGTYDARVRMDSGTYSVPVEVIDGQVERVRWSDGGQTLLRGADIVGAEAYGRDFAGNRVRVEIANPGYSTDDDLLGLDDSDPECGCLADPLDEDSEE